MDKEAFKEAVFSRFQAHAKVFTEETLKSHLNGLGNGLTVVQSVELMLLINRHFLAYLVDSLADVLADYDIQKKKP